ncbi:hypothetical protein CU669_18650 [Paramagnetospirillum kuznetsovii]|uniref:Uncharacterized protein n=1 Tax=Paramagnetospirillum kuznetsovii TaxID=2053833 RepID=A0A364NTI7_9PROT|nr:hypothetical protein [Paramagnetospirillum kuznetsovii]RAU20409.1 hypothetical protein CU669_18650 [Paramagnetospirillum kuznetsovii]
MFRWNMSLETGLEAIDHGRRQLLEAMADFFQILDNPALNQKLVAERTGAIFTAMKAAFTAEDQYLKTRSESEGSPHMATHAAFMLSYVELCKKLVPKIKNIKQGQQACLEIYRNIDGGLYHHINDEALAYKHMVKHPAKAAEKA